MTSYTQKSDFIHHYRTIKVNIGHLQFAEAVSGRRVPCRLPGTWLLSSGVSSPLGTSTRHAKQKNTQPQPELGNQAPTEIRSGKKLQWGSSENPAGTWRRRDSIPGAGGGPAPGVWPSPGQRGRTPEFPHSPQREGCAHGLPGGAACGQHGCSVSPVLLAEEGSFKTPVCRSR